MFIIVGNYTCEQSYNQSNISITWYNNETNNYLQIQENDYFELILIENNQIQKQETTKQEIIILNNDYNKYYIEDNQLINNLDTYNFLMDDDYENLYVKISNKVEKYKNIIENVYVINNETVNKTTNEINFNNFDSNIFTYFENIMNEEKYLNIKNNEIIYSIKTFNDKYIFLEDLTYIFNNHKNYDIFEHYGYCMIIENKFKNQNQNQEILNEITIINFKSNEDFMKNQEKWFEYFDKYNKNLILLFDDFSYYEYLNEILNFEELLTNYVIIINYSKSTLFLHIYMNKLLINLINLCKFEMNEQNKLNINYFVHINNINKIKSIKTQTNLIIDNNFVQTINSKIDFIIFMIYFYIKNKNSLILNSNSNFRVNYIEYKKINI